MGVLLELSRNPYALLALLVAFAWLWEDGSLIAGALLAVDQHLSILMAVIGVFVGIVSGDIGLYYLGMLGRRVRKIRAWILLNRHSRKMRRQFKRRIVLNIMIIRFVPGLRTLGFAVCGLWALSFRRFLMATVLAGIFWIALIFPVIYLLGSAAWFESRQWKWGLMGLALVLLVFNQYWSSKRLAVGVN